jgi:hypothetical protein
MNSIVFALSLIFMPLAIPFVAFYVACKMVLNGFNKKLEEMGAEL